MKKTDKKIIVWILLIGIFQTIRLPASCQTPLIEWRKDSTQLAILRQISDPKVKRQVLRVLENYPAVKTQRDTCEKILSYQKTAGLYQQQQIALLEQKNNAKETELLETKNLKEKYRKKAKRRGLSNLTAWALVAYITIITIK